MNSIIKKPSAWVPIALSLGILAMILITLVLSWPPVRQADEGIEAHLFQIWLVLEFLMVAFFALKWLPRAPRQALLILAIQIALVLAACFPVAYFKL